MLTATDRLRDRRTTPANFSSPSWRQGKDSAEIVWRITGRVGNWLGPRWLSRKNSREWNFPYPRTDPVQINHDLKDAMRAARGMNHYAHPESRHAGISRAYQVGIYVCRSLTTCMRIIVCIWMLDHGLRAERQRGTRARHVKHSFQATPCFWKVMKVDVRGWFGLQGQSTSRRTD